MSEEREANDRQQEALAEAKPSKVAKLSGTPNSLIVTCPVVETRALRASRSCQQRRECARCVRDRITFAVPDETAAGGGRLTSMRWCRTSCIQARRYSLRPQSRQRSGAEPTASGCEPHADLARLCCRAALPLTLLAQRTRAAPTNAGRIDHTQTPISALFAAPGE